MAGEFFLSALGQQAGQSAANTALNSASNGMLSNMMSMGLPNLNTGLLSSLSGLGGKIWDTVGSEQFGNAVQAGSSLFNGWNQYNQGKDYSKILKSQEARASDAYNRDKIADEKRQLLVF